jgi:hypothetical protein
MASLDVSSMEAVLKQHYLDMRVENMVYKDEPFLAWLPKYTKFGGKNLPLPVQFAVIAGRSRDFATAQSNAAPSKFRDFVLTRVHDYAVAHIDNEAMMASMGDKNAFLQATVTEINGAIRAATRSLASALPRSGTGSVGKVGSISTTALTLETIEDVVNFEVGDKIQASAADGGTLRAATAIEVVAINRDTGVLTGSGNWSGIASLTAGDFLYKQGDAQAAGASPLKVTGLDGWLPSTAPTGGDSFFGVDRSVDATRLGGVRYSIPANGETYEEGLMSAAARLHREGGRPEVVWMNPLEWVKLAKELGSRVQFDIVKSSNGKIGFKAITLTSPKGDLKVLADHNFPMGVAYMLDKSTWKLYSLGKAPQILTYGDGAGRFLRRSAADGVEVRVGYYAQLGCNAPGYNCRITLS